jgi:hypothetical protein
VWQRHCAQGRFGILMAQRLNSIDNRLDSRAGVGLSTFQMLERSIKLARAVIEKHKRIIRRGGWRFLFRSGCVSGVGGAIHASFEKRQELLFIGDDIPVS